MNLVPLCTDESSATMSVLMNLCTDVRQEGMQAGGLPRLFPSNLLTLGALPSVIDSDFVLLHSAVCCQ